MKRRRSALLALLPLALLSMAVERPSGLGDVSDVRTWSYPDYTRVVIELTQPVRAEVRRLAADSGAKRPERLYLDLDGIWVGRRYVDGIPVGDGLLQGVRLGQNTLEKSRVVIDLERYERHRLITLRSPHRVVVDVYGRREDPAKLRWRRPDSASEGSRLSMPLRPVQTVVVDPGHGGKDPGAIGLGGVYEKDVNLRLGRLLRSELQERGFRVVMTRDDDSFLDLEERTALAESSGGDLFVSVHANASRRKAARGIEIYYLDQNHERHILDVAARENGVPRSEMDSLQHALARLRVSEASVHSARLAELVHDEVLGEITKRHRGMPDLGVKQGPFYVLFLSSMPAILMETGFLTNRQDIRLLRSEKYLATVAERTASGLSRYRDSGGEPVGAGG